MAFVGGLDEVFGCECGLCRVVFCSLGDLLCELVEEGLEREVFVGCVD